MVFQKPFHFALEATSSGAGISSKGMAEERSTVFSWIPRRELGAGISSKGTAEERSTVFSWIPK